MTAPARDALEEWAESVRLSARDEVLASVQARIDALLYRRHMTVAECAQYLRSSSSTVRRLIRDGEIPHASVRGHLILRQQDVDAYLDRQIEASRTVPPKKGGRV